MFRTLTAIAAGMILLPCQAALAAETDAQQELATDATPPVSTLRSQPQRLQSELERHRALADAGGWPAVPDGATIWPDAVDSRLATLARRLVISEDLSDTDTLDSISEYNQTLQDAVRRFQARHGPEVDGLVGRKTLRALNVPIEQRIDQIRVNLERARHLTENQDDGLVVVNIPAFKASVIHGGETMLTTKVIVGESETETPEFRATMTHVVFNPTWTVPYSIASEELLPKIKEDPGFFDKGKYQLFERDGSRIDPSSVDWAVINAANFPFTLVQQPGPSNQLGQIKFMFPNEYSVCMHDTPAKLLFAKAARAFSHGCIRVDEPLGFASVVLDVEGWTREQIDSQVNSKETATVALSDPLPVLVLYMTAEVDDLGTVYFYDDIYERDAEILRTLVEQGQAETIRSTH